MQRDLVIRAQRGDVAAFSTLTEGMTPRLFAVARLILRSDDLAADAVQDALLQAWLDLRGLRDPDRFEAWQRRLLVRACYRAAKRTRSRQVVEIVLGPGTEPVSPDSQRSVAIHDQLERGFRRLSADQRTLLVLYHFLDLSLAETAGALGVPIGTVQSRLSRATQALRAALEADDRPSSLASEVVR